MSNSKHEATFGPYDQENPAHTASNPTGTTYAPQGPAPKKSHKGLKVAGGIFLVLALFGACTTALGANTADTPAAPAPEATPAAPEATETPDPEATPTPTAEETPEATEESTPATPGETPEQREALEAAQNYVDMFDFSEKGLFDQLTSEHGSNFDKKDAQYALEHVTVSYNDEALDAAKSYREMFSMSKKELKQQLTSEYGSQFTESQANFAISHLDD